MAWNVCGCTFSIYWKLLNFPKYFFFLKSQERRKRCSCLILFPAVATIHACPLILQITRFLLNMGFCAALIFCVFMYRTWREGWASFCYFDVSYPLWSIFLKKNIYFFFFIFIWNEFLLEENNCFRLRLRFSSFALYSF